MTNAHFQSQVGRLLSTYGKQGFPEERAILLWREIQGFDDAWLTKTIDRIIGECRQAPLLSDFRDAISEERERRWQIEKKQNAKEAKEFMGTAFPEEDRRWVIQQILRRIGGGMTDDHFESFLSHLEESGEHYNPPMDCGVCEDTGLIWARNREDKSQAIFKCQCRHGSIDRRNYPIWSKVFEQDYDLEVLEVSFVKLVEAP